MRKMNFAAAKKRLVAERRFSAVAQIVDFRLRRSKMLYLSMGID
jgi:hypothetical protein